MNIRSYKSAIHFVLLLVTVVPLRSQQDQNAQQPQTQQQPLQQQANSPAQAPASASCGPGGCISVNDTGAGTGTPQLLNGVPVPQYRGQLSNNPTSPLNSREPLDPSSETPIMSNLERFVQDSLGHKLPVFGRKLFLNTPIDFQATTAVSAPADYVIGTGDQLRIRGWGAVSIDAQVTVDRGGQIFIPQIGSISLAGTRADQLQTTVQRAVDAQYRNVKVTATLGQLRSIQVFVLGQVRHPGVYTISSLSTLVNALFASGGPSESGSLRDIQLKRGDQTITHFDVYRLLLYGDKSKDVHLLPGDVIYIPVVGPQVAVDGEVKNAGIYELFGDNSVEDAIEFAGGLSPLAELSRASLIRVVDHAKRASQDFPLNGAQKLIPMMAGDVLRVFPISSEIGKTVTLKGDVAQPGQYGWHTGMRISDLIPNRNSLIPRNYFNKVNNVAPVTPQRPFKASERRSQRSDALTPSTDRRPYQRKNNQSTKGQVSTSEGEQETETDFDPYADPYADPRTEPSKTNGQAQRGNGTQIRSLSPAEAEAAGSAGFVVDSTSNQNFGNHDAEINWNYAVIERLNRQTFKTEIISFVLGEAVDNPGSTENKTLESGDVVTIYTHNDINLPTELRARFVRIDGEVLRPGVYAIGENETLQSVLKRAGGVGPHAYLYAAQLTRESVRIAEEAKLRAFVRQATLDATSPVNNNIVGADGRSTIADQDTRQAYIRALQQIHATGRITLQLPPTASQIEDLPDFAMQDGDHFFVPPRPNTVDVIGSVFNQGSMRYVPGKRVRNYLKIAGGSTKTGDKGQEFVLRADGSVLSRATSGNFDKLDIFAGDTVVVPARMRGGWSVFQYISVGQIASSIALTAIALSNLNR